MTGTNTQDSLEEYLNQLRTKYQNESKETLGDDEQRYAEVQGALEVINRIQQHVKDTE